MAGALGSGAAAAGAATARSGTPAPSAPASRGGKAGGSASISLRESQLLAGMLMGMLRCCDNVMRTRLGRRLKLRLVYIVRFKGTSQSAKKVIPPWGA